jgi:hypothetical protein
MGSVRTPWNPYDNGIMYMPANLKEYSKDPMRVKVLFEEMFNRRCPTNDADAKNGCVFIMTVKAHMPYKYWDKFTNMPPVFRNKLIDAADQNVIGKVNADQIKKLKVKRGEERKLTCLLDTCGEYMTFGSYYMFFLTRYDVYEQTH